MTWKTSGYGTRMKEINRKPPSPSTWNDTWNNTWHTYGGRVRIILSDTSVAYGKVTKVYPKKVRMEILTDDGWHIESHPQYIWPVPFGETWL